MQWIDGADNVGNHYLTSSNRGLFFKRTYVLRIKIFVCNIYFVLSNNSPQVVLQLSLLKVRLGTFAYNC